MCVLAIRTQALTLPVGLVPFSYPCQIPPGQYHYFELPDPTCAFNAEGCLKVDSYQEADACYATDDLQTTLFHEVDDELCFRD